MNKQAKMLPWLGYGVSFFLILIALAGFRLYIARNSGKLINYEMTINADRAINSGMEMDIHIYNDWVDTTNHEDLPIGAQYDMELVNHTENVLSGWILTVDLPQEIFVDSFWNGEFRVEDGKLLVDCVDYNTEIQPGEKITLGAVVYSDSLLSFSSAGITASSRINYIHTPVFWILLTAVLIWVLGVIVGLAFQRRAAKYINQQKRDSQVILQAMNTFAGLIDLRDSYTYGHSTRVAAYSGEIARRMKMTQNEIQTVHYMGLMHDCGKVGVPDDILNKPGKLSEEEWKIIQSHTVVGGKVLEDFTAIPELRQGALYHHERYDGKGYPEGLKGEEIPLYARIICVADCYDAMSSKRCYRNALPEEVIIRELQENAGKQFDPVIVPYMVEMIRDGFVNLVHNEIGG